MWADVVLGRLLWVCPPPLAERVIKRKWVERCVLHGSEAAEPRIWLAMGPGRKERALLGLRGEARGREEVVKKRSLKKKGRLPVVTEGLGATVMWSGGIGPSGGSVHHVLGPPSWAPADPVRGSRLVGEAKRDGESRGGVRSRVRLKGKGGGVSPFDHPQG